MANRSPHADSEVPGDEHARSSAGASEFRPRVSPVLLREAHAWASHAIEQLDEHHLIAWSRNVGVRERFALELARHLHLMPDTETVVLAGVAMHSLDGFCRQLERALPGADPAARVRRSVHLPGGVVDRLRERPTSQLLHIKRRYYIWRDADVLLKHDPRAFGRLVDAMSGVAAESEYASEDLLLIHRVVFIGGSGLMEYGRDPHGSFRAWLEDPDRGPAPAAEFATAPAPLSASRDQARPFWEVVSGLDRPPFARLHLH
jgi:hypothetical protein